MKRSIALAVVASLLVPSFALAVDSKRAAYTGGTATIFKTHFRSAASATSVVLHVTLVDQVIVSAGETFSFRKAGLL